MEEVGVRTVMLARCLMVIYADEPLGKKWEGKGGMRRMKRRR